jgi:hypothetical protein
MAPTTRPGHVLIDADPYLRAVLVGMLRQLGCAHKTVASVSSDITQPAPPVAPRRSSRQLPPACPADTLGCNHSATQLCGPRLPSLGRLGKPAPDFRCKWPQFL